MRCNKSAVIASQLCKGTGGTIGTCVLSVSAPVEHVAGEGGRCVNASKAQHCVRNAVLPSLPQCFISLAEVDSSGVRAREGGGVVE